MVHEQVVILKHIEIRQWGRIVRVKRYLGQCCSLLVVGRSVEDRLAGRDGHTVLARALAVRISRTLAGIGNAVFDVDTVLWSSFSSSP